MFVFWQQCGRSEEEREYREGHRPVMNIAESSRYEEIPDCVKKSSKTEWLDKCFVYYTFPPSALLIGMNHNLNFHIIQ